MWRKDTAARVKVAVSYKNRQVCNNLVSIGGHSSFTFASYYAITPAALEKDCRSVAPIAAPPMATT